MVLDRTAERFATQVEQDRLELGVRVAMCLYGENVDSMRREWVIGRAEQANFKARR